MNETAQIRGGIKKLYHVLWTSDYPWYGTHKSGSQTIARCLGYYDCHNLFAEGTDRDLAVMKQLVGPHGATIYKMLLARMKANG